MRSSRRHEIAFAMGPEARWTAETVEGYEGTCEHESYCNAVTPPIRRRCAVYCGRDFEARAQG